MDKQKFVLKSSYKPAGSQPQAIKELLEGLDKGYNFQTLLGVTVSQWQILLRKLINQL